MSENNSNSENENSENDENNNNSITSNLYKQSKIKSNESKR